MIEREKSNENKIQRHLDISREDFVQNNKNNNSNDDNDYGYDDDDDDDDEKS